VTDLATLATLADGPEVGPQTMVTENTMDDVQALSAAHPGSHMLGVKVQMSATEAAVGVLVGTLYQAIEATLAMVGKVPSAKGRVVSMNPELAARGCAILCIEAVKIAWSRCAAAKEDDPRCIAAHTMIATLVEALKTTDFERNPHNIIAACRLFYQCAHGVLRNDAPDSVRNAAVVTWKNQLGGCMRV